MRKTFDELEKLKKKYKTDRLWSWSRVNCIHYSLYEYYLKYIKHVPADRDDSIYKVTGGISHDVIEKFYNGSITKEEMLDNFEDGWIVAFDISNLKFNRTDSERNNTIADKYYMNLKLFFKNHIPIKTKMVLEQFITVKIGDEYFQGYIDALTKDKEGNYNIIDWKTSSIYKGDKAINECGQLVLYAIGLNQQGIPWDKIKICWNFLKYVKVTCEKSKTYNVKWTTAKGEEKSKEKLDESKIASTLKASVKALLKQKGYDKWKIESIINRFEKENNISVLPEDIKSNISIEECKVENKPREIERALLGESLQANVKSWMKKLGYSDDDIFTYLDLLIQTNDISVLPDDVQSKYTIEDCYVYVPITEELIKHWEDYVIEATSLIREKEEEYSISNDESIWFEDEESVKANSYYFANLCEYSANIHKPYAAYIEKYNAEHSDTTFNTGNKKDEIPEDDLSWLDEIVV